MIVLFTRANHPSGYGYGDRAHGYVVVGFRCRDQREVRKVVHHVRTYGIDLPDESRIIFDHNQLQPGPVDGNHHYKNVGYPGVHRWYSGGPGDWDYLWTTTGNRLIDLEGWHRPTHGSRGDNRFAWIYDAKDLFHA